MAGRIVWARGFRRDAENDTRDAWATRGDGDALEISGAFFFWTVRAGRSGDRAGARPADKMSAALCFAPHRGGKGMTGRIVWARGFRRDAGNDTRDAWATFKN